MLPERGKESRPPLPIGLQGGRTEEKIEAEMALGPGANRMETGAPTPDLLESQPKQNGDGGTAKRRHHDLDQTVMAICILLLYIINSIPFCALTFTT